jgi:hypothetical protein
MAFGKGSPRHALAGKVFVASMLTMAAAAVYLAVIKHQPNNIGGGILTFYLIGTAWLTARRRDGETSIYDWAALVIPLAIGIGGWINGGQALHSPTGEKYGVPAGMHMFMGSVCLLAAAGDVRMLLRGGVFGVQRIVRHLSGGCALACLSPPGRFSWDRAARCSPPLCSRAACFSSRRSSHWYC